MKYNCFLSCLVFQKVIVMFFKTTTNPTNYISIQYTVIDYTDNNMCGSAHLCSTIFSMNLVLFFKGVLSKTGSSTNSIKYCNTTSQKTKVQDKH